MKVEDRDILNGAERALQEIIKAEKYFNEGEIEEAIIHAWIATELAINSVKAILNGVVTTKHLRFVREASRLHLLGILSEDFSKDVDNIEKWRIWAEHAPYSKYDEPSHESVIKTIKRLKRLIMEVYEYVREKLRT